MGAIRILPPQVANQIAAGEVVERPASVVKELVENAIDAGARRIRVTVEQGGRRRIEVDDDGCGMDAEDARLALVRHATSKIETLADLHRIASCGFRGEALASIASVSRLRLHTAPRGADEGVRVECDGGGEVRLSPAPPRCGTRVEVRDLFFNAPARRKFLRSDAVEEAVIVETVRQLGLAHPRVALRLTIGGRLRLDWAKQDRPARAAAVLGREAAADAVWASAEHRGVRAEGLFARPTCSHRDASRILLVVNGRPVRDRGLIAAVRAGYRDVLMQDRYPICALWLDLDPAAVDVNVHPAKREVRFARPQEVRAAAIAAVRAALDRAGGETSRAVTEAAVRAAHRSVPPAPAERIDAACSSVAGRTGSLLPPPAVRRSIYDGGRSVDDEAAPASPDVVREAGRLGAWAASHRFGRAIAQLHRRFVLAETDEGLLLVDQHAAHERIVFEQMKRAIARGGVPAQPLLTPVRWRPDPALAAWLGDGEHADAMARFGVEVAPAGEGAWLIRALPAPLAGEDPIELAERLADGLRLCGEAARGPEGLDALVTRWLADRACKAAVRFGRRLSIEEMQALLDEMARTPNIAQCNHGRPTFVRLSLSDLERLFAR